MNNLQLIEAINKSGLFDAEWYLKEYPDVVILGINPVEHYVRYGERLGRQPSPAFSPTYYLEANADVAAHQISPFYHYIVQGKNEGRLPCGIVSKDNKKKLEIVEQACYVPKLNAAPLTNLPARLIAFYLPQFHPIAENNAWWGEGFTEWTNVKPSQPQFVGHYQPHIPGELGYYSLLDTETQRKQIELAKLYGLGGFCFYFYWFGGKRLLETPIENYLNDPSLDFPFCLCWANENWSRRWDGLDSDILIAQQHSPQDDLAFIQYVSKYMRDPRYIRIGGKPLLLVYRPSLLPNAKETTQRWRKWCRENGIGEIYLAYTQSFEAVDPAQYDFDAAIEFPPNNSAPPNITSEVVPLNVDFGSTVYDWSIFVGRSESYRDPGYKLFRGVTPCWDNTARKKNKGTVFFNSSPKLFTKWLTNAFVDTLRRRQDPDERIVFVNAWNEWAEGAHLEPDLKYGYAWLQSVRDAYEAVLQKRGRIVVVTHDAHPHGAQILCLNIVKYYKEQFGLDADLIVLGEGILIDKYAKFATVHRLNLATADQQFISQMLTELKEKGADVAIVNSTVSGRLIPYLKAVGFSVVALVHELPNILRSYSLKEHAKNISELADKVVFPAPQVRDGFEAFIGRKLTQAVIRPQGLYLRSLLRAGANKEDFRGNVRGKLGLPASANIIMCAGYADHRKGFDLFVRACMRVFDQVPNTYALWVGHLDQGFVDQSLDVAIASGHRDRFVFTGLVDQPQEYFIAADVYALTSREDPFPSVVLEALDALTPVVAFKGCGGFEELLKRDCGVLVPSEDCEAYAEAIIRLLRTPEQARALATNGQRIVESELSFKHYLFDLLAFANKPLLKVSVVVPNYKYEKYIRQRLETVVNQTYPIYELIVLDDMSPDDSVKVIQDFLHTTEVPSRLLVNEKNSGSVFKQWRKGVELARGDLVWIAEADDLAEPQFLDRLVDFFRDPDTVLAFSQSKQIDEYGNIIANDYLDYTEDLGGFWRNDYLIDGKEEIKRALCIKNSILNVSGVLFRRDRLDGVLNEIGDELANFKVAGDWVIYLYLASKGKIGFCEKSLNLHRRHVNSVTRVHNHLSEVIEVHRLAEQFVSIDPTIQSKIDKHIAHLERYFSGH